jgi:hypothetical protein
MKIHEFIKIQKQLNNDQMQEREKGDLLSNHIKMWEKVDDQ